MCAPFVHLAARNADGASTCQVEAGFDRFTTGILAPAATLLTSPAKLKVGRGSLPPQGRSSSGLFHFRESHRTSYYEISRKSLEICERMGASEKNYFAKRTQSHFRTSPCKSLTQSGFFLGKRRKMASETSKTGHIAAR